MDRVNRYASHNHQKSRKKLIKHVICSHRAPQVILSDNAAYFTANLLKQVCRACGIHKQTSMAYHPQTNCVVERINRMIKTMLATFVNGNTVGWDIYLSLGIGQGSFETLGT